VLRQMESAGTRLNLVILDACRNNPFGGRGLRALSTGLAQMQAPEGTLISFATQPGNVAQDGNGQHSPFSQALSAAMRKRGLGLFETFNEVGLEVKRSTGGVQQPWLSSSPIAGNFYFAGRPGQAAPAKDAGMNEREVAALEERLKALEQKLNERRETKFADVSPQARPIAPKPHTPMISLESLAQNFLADYMRHSEGSLDEVLAYVQNTYATEVDYFGDHMSNRKVAADQRRYVTKWPQRSFRRKPETTRIVCNKASSSCRVSGELEFNVANPATAKTSAGVATYEFQVVFAAGGAKIVSENGRVMSRRN
jgi:hypothetical protein